MALPPSSANFSLTYGRLPGLEAGTTSDRASLVSQSPKNSSIHEQKSTSPSGIISRNTSSTLGSQAPLIKRQSLPRRKFLKEKLRHRQSSFRQRFRSSVNRDRKPSTALTFPSVAAFIGFLGFLSIAVHFPIKPVWIAVMMIGGSLLFGLVLACFIEYRRGKGKYIPERGYSVLVIVMAIPVFAGLYAKSWYPQLRSNMLITSTDSVIQVQFPSIAILQRKDWSSQGNLRSGGSKCYLGWYDDNAPDCASINQNTLGNSTVCTCKELWYNHDEVIEDFIWMNTSYRYKVFDSPSWFIGHNPTYMLLLQTFFDYNATKALDESSTTNPSLMIAVYDSKLGMQNAFELGYTRMNLVNANGIVAVNIGLQVRDGGTGKSAYDYPLSLVSSPATDLVCDTSSAETYKYPCHMSLFIQVPNFDRSTITTEKVMTWMDTATAAGGYFSFLQFLSWIISAQAWLAQ